MGAAVLICGPSGDEPPAHSCDNPASESMFDQWEWHSMGYGQRRCPKCGLYMWVSTARSERNQKRKVK